MKEKQPHPLSEEEATFSWGKQATRYFYELTPDRILDAVEQFGLPCTGRLMPLNSMENRVFEIGLESPEPRLLNKPSCIVKFYRPGRWTREQILDEHTFLADLRQEEIPVVAPLADPSGNTLPQAHDLGIWYTIFPKTGGRHPDELDNEQLRRIGRLIARLHKAGAKRPAPHRLRLTEETYGELSLDFLLDHHLIPPSLENRIIDTLETLCDIAAPLFDQLPHQRIHGDAHLGNLLWGDDGPFWLDFDDMLRGPCIQDLWLITPGHDTHSLHQRDTLLEAYDTMLPLPPQSLRLVEPLRALRAIHFAAWIGKRWSDPAFQRTFDFYGSDTYWRELAQDLEESLSRTPKS